MHYMKTRFSLISLAFGLGMILDATAAPSVRVLGSNAGYSAGVKTATDQSATAVKTGNTISSSVLGTTAGAKKSASIKTVSPKTTAIAPISRSASNRTNTIVPTKTATVKTVAGSTNSERFPGIATKTNVQGIGKTGTISTTGKPTSTNTSGYNIKDMDDRLTTIEDTVSSKVDTQTLDNYYTKDEIEGIRGDYYTAAQVEDRISDIDASASSQYIRFLTQTVNLHSEQIQDLATQDGSVYDTHSGDKKMVYFVTDFDANAVLGEEQPE